MRTNSLSVFATVAAVVATLSSCTVGENPVERGDEHAALVLEGPALAEELASSPAHAAGHAFRRIGVMFDGERPTAIELSTSTDGQTWSEWRAIELRHVEVEAESTLAAFAGELVIDGEPATHFRLRGLAASVGTVAPTHARIDVFESALSETLESAVGDSEPEADAALEAALTGVTIRTRAEWGAKSTNCTSTHTPKRITVHHTVSPNNDSMSTPARLRQIQSYHRNVRGWCDVGYHYLISRDGQIWEGRQVKRLGAHTAGANTDNVGISLIGTYDTVPPTQAQQDATAALIRSLGSKYGISISRSSVKGHRERGTTATACPGQKTFDRLPEIVEAAKGTAPPPPSPPTPTTITGTIYRGSDPAVRISGATVTIDGKSDNTSTNGNYKIEGVTPGVHTIEITKAGFTTTKVKRDTRVVTKISAGLSDASSGSAVLQGVIYRGTDSLDRIPKAKVQLSTGHTLTADDNGLYTIGSLPPGTITITASAAGHTVDSVERTLINGQTEWGSVSLD